MMEQPSPPRHARRAVSALCGLLAFGAYACGNSGTGADTGLNDASPDSAVDAVVSDATSDTALDAASDAATDVARTDAGLPMPPVGVTTRTFVDDTRGTPANGTEPASASRTLVTEIWYPAGSSAPDAGNAPVRDAPTDGHAHPLVVFVHGSSGTRAQSTFLTVALARAGYVIAAADFPLTSLNTPGGASDTDVNDQPGDVSFLATSLGNASADGTDPLAGAIDASHFAVVGHSTGATVALVMAYAPDVHDDRLAASIALAPCACFFADSFFRTRALPLLVVAGTDDLFVPVSNNGARAYSLAGPPREMVTLVGGNHLYFTDLRIGDDSFDPTPTNSDDPIAMSLASYGGGTACQPVPPRGTDPPMTPEVQHRETVQWTSAFLDATLRAQPAALEALESATDVNVTVQHDGI